MKFKFVLIIILTFCEIIIGGKNIDNKYNKYPMLTEYFNYLQEYLGKVPNKTVKFRNEKSIVVDEYIDNNWNEVLVTNNLNKSDKNEGNDDDFRVKFITGKPKKEQQSKITRHIQKIPPRLNKKLKYDLQVKLNNLLELIKTNTSDWFDEEYNNELIEYQTIIPENTTFPLNMKIVENKLAAVPEERMLNLFTIINFNNHACLVENAYFSFNGTCYHESECKSLGGKAMGSCSRNFGVCCIFQYSCGGRSSNVRSYFINPEYPAPSKEPLSCSFLLQKVNKDIVQIRVDFELFELMPPVNGTCIDDQFVISGQNINNIVPILCGINNGQHVYLDVTDSMSPLMFSVMSNKAHDRIFRIQLTQLSSKNRCPNLNCMQYFTGTKGIIESFNYQESGSVIRNNKAGYLNNLNYAVCIQKAPGYCTITYKNVDDSGYEYPFQLVNLDEEGGMLFPPEQAGAEIFNCPDDFIAVNGIRLCGDRFNDGSISADFRVNAPVTDYSAGPFWMPVHTNQNINGRGFKLIYNQNRCVN